MYYRTVKKSNSPMSDWGHAMFSDHIDPWQGEPNYTYDGSQAVNVLDLSDEIKAKWNQCLEDGYFGDSIDPNAEAAMLGVSADDAADQFAPKDIISSAQAFDDADWTTWFCENIVEPNGIKAVLTPDGAIVFDESLIKRRNVEAEA
jgi:hypothetical protein